MGVLGEALAHPDEILPALRMIRAQRKATRLPKDPNLAFCYEILNKVSRSFAVVIQQLPKPLRDAVCVFYLVLRALDTIEDDMSIPVEIKVPQLLNFYKELGNREFQMACGKGEYARLMKEFSIVVDVFSGLADQMQEVIVDITKRMGAGMAEFIQKEVVTVEDYDLYCHYAAGLVGIGLTELFVSSGLESAVQMEDQDNLSNHMGLFLQKTNIIRDYLEDICEEPAPRMFWPEDVWHRHVDKLSDLKERKFRTPALHCLNEMVTNALRHLVQCVTYLKMLEHHDVFRFCAIPQIMALGTLTECYNNGGVFEGKVKMRRGQTACVFDQVDNMADVYRWFLLFLGVLETKASREVGHHDPSLTQCLAVIRQAQAVCLEGLEEERQKAGPKPVSWPLVVLDYTLLILFGWYFYLAWGMGGAQIPLLWGKDLGMSEWVHQLLAALLLLYQVVVVVTRIR